MSALRPSIAFAAFAANLFAQNAQLTGRVTDWAGAVVPGVELMIRNIATGVERPATTNEVGTAGFGVITISQAPRNPQFGLKLIW